MLEAFRGNPEELPNDWLDRFKDVTDLQNLDDREKLVCARLMMKGNAANWYSAHKQQITTFAEFESHFLSRFADDSLSIANALFGRFQHNNENVRVYADSIFNLHDRLQLAEKPLPECVLTNHFVNGMQQDLREKVMSRRPKNLQDAIDDAVFLEQCLNNEARARRPFSQHPTPAQNTYQGNKPSYQKNNDRPFNNGNKFGSNRPQHAPQPAGQNKENYGQNRPQPAPYKDPKDDIINDLSRKLNDLKIEFSQAETRPLVHQNFFEMETTEEHISNLPKHDPKIIADLRDTYMTLYNAYAAKPQPQDSFACLNYLEASNEDLGIADLPPLDNPTINKYLDDIKELIASAARILKLRDTSASYAAGYDIYAEKRKPEENKEEWVKRPNNLGQDAFDPQDAMQEPPAPPQPQPRRAPVPPVPPPPQPQPQPHVPPAPQQHHPQHPAPSSRPRAAAPAPAAAPRAPGSPQSIGFPRPAWTLLTS